MSDIRIKLPDGSARALKKGANSLDLAKDISQNLAKKVVVALVNGQVTDLQDPLSDGDEVMLLDVTSPQAQDVIAHSCEHILAAAVVELFPHAQVTMGPKSHRDGFYYDFDIGRPFSEEDLAQIEKKMTFLIDSGVTFHKRWVNKAQAKEIFAGLKQAYKPEILDWIPGDDVTLYESGKFIDLCRGPHLPSSRFIKGFKLQGSSGSYWRADASREMLQRISGVAFASKQELDDYLFRIEEAKKRDHRKIGPKQDLFFVSEKFSTFSDAQLKESEARVLIHWRKQSGGSMASLVADVENLLANIACSLPSRTLAIKSINTSQVQGEDSEKSSIDLRIFAAAADKNGRPIVDKLIDGFNESRQDAHIKYHFDTFANEEIGPGLVMWLPKGGRLRSLVEDFSRKRHFLHGYEMVYSPHIAKSDLWRISGHLGFYKDSMFAPMNVDGNEYLLKPMNCPFHVMMYKFKPKSYRDLPLRWAEFGTVYRYEMAGVLHGLMRVRGFTQDDAHIFCRWDQLDFELDKVLAFVMDMLRAFGFHDFEVNISTKPEKFVGENEGWDRAETSLKAAVGRTGLSHIIDEGGGAFYGPKIDIKLKDSLGRMWQCSTIQVDFNNPERFDLEYTNSEGKKERPVMLHRALFGSLERFIGILIENYAGALPEWLSPEQVRILTVSDRHNAHGEAVLKALLQANIRAEFVHSHEKLGAKIREAQMDKVPIMIVVGDQEVANLGGTIRLRSQEDKGFFGMDALVQEVVTLCAEPK